MTDYLLVHGAGQGAWSWGHVWGRLTAPEEHPPTLHKRRRANPHTDALVTQIRALFAKLLVMR